MKLRKAYKFRLNVSAEKQANLFAFAGCCRFVWNKFFHINQSRLRDKQRILRYQEMDFWSKLYKRSEEYGFLKQCHSQLLQQKLKDLDKAYSDGFDIKQPIKRMPRKKKKGRHDSFRYPQGFKINGNNIFLPKLGWFRFRQSQKIIGIPKNVTVSYHCGHWYVSVQTEQEIVEAKHPKTSMIGIDLGVKRFATLSDGQYFSSKNHFRRLEKKLAKAQKRLSRKTKYSNNWHNQKKKIQRLHSKIANARKDYLHWCSNRISKNHAIVVLEDLKVSNMSKSAKGKEDNPGSNVKAKSGLNKSILDQGWGEFRRQLEYKLSWQGGDLLLVAPQYTSQTCPVCGHVSRENRKTGSFQGRCRIE